MARLSRLTARKVASSGSIALARTLPRASSSLSLRTHDQEHRHQHDANAEQRVVRDREDCPERSNHKGTAPEEDGANSPEERAES